MIIFDEKQHVQNMLINGFTLGKPHYELQLLATYYRELGYNDEAIENELNLFCLKFQTDYNRVKSLKSIEEKVNRSKKLKLKTSTPINITQNELDVILKQENLKYQKLMFVYLVLAKYYMSNNHTDKYYVSVKDNEIFKLCDMYVKSADKLTMMHELTKQQLITPTLNMSSIVNYVDESSDIVLTLIPKDDLVLYFEQYLGEFITHCEICGKLTHKRSNRTKYCPSCSREMKSTRKKSQLENVGKH